MPQYDLHERCLIFAQETRKVCGQIRINNIIENDIKQLLRSSASIGANYIEASERLGRKDIKFRLKIALKEAKETVYWLKIIRSSIEQTQEFDNLLNEANQILAILISINNKLS